MFSNRARKSHTDFFCLRIGLLDINLNLNVSNGTNANTGTVVSSTSATTSTTHQQVFLGDGFSGLNRMQQVSGELAKVKDEQPLLPVAKPAVELSDEQRNILKLVKSGQNVFFTGPAGDTIFESCT